MAIDLDAFKAGMRRLAAGVCLITTTDRDGNRAGLTATAVCSVSAVPPTLLICVNRQNSSHAVIRDAGVFAVNALALEDRTLADRFASPLTADEKFSSGVWSRLESASPVLDSALVCFDCRITHTVEVGTHAIFFGEIQAINYSQGNTSPLLYSQGSYGAFLPVGAARGADPLWFPNWDGGPAY